MQARMQSPVSIFPEAQQAINELKAIIDKTKLAPTTRNLAQLRTSQINGSSACILTACQQARAEGETDVRLIGLTGWRESPYFTESERAALALAEEVTRLEGAEPVPDNVWQDAIKHFDEQSMSALLLTIVLANTSNRLNVSTRQVAGV